MAGYVRVSLIENEQASLSPDVQRDAIRGTLARAGYPEEPRWFEDLSLSGVTFDKRDAYQELLGALASGEITVVAAYAQDRLTRSLRDTLDLIDLVIKHSIRVYAPAQWNTDTPEGIMAITQVGTFAAYEHAKISQRLLHTFERKGREGFMMGQPPIGYKRLKVCANPNCRFEGVGIKICPKCNSKSIGERVDIVEEEAELVIKIFGMYIGGAHSIQSIARYATAQGWRTRKKTKTSPEGGLMTQNSVQTILKNLTYAGYKTLDDRPAPQRKSGLHKYQLKQRRDSIPENRIKGKWEPIISMETWDKAAAKSKAAKKVRRNPDGKRYTYSMTPILFCSECGKAINGDFKKGLRGYRCMTSRRGGGICTQNGFIVERELEEEFAKILFSISVPKEATPMVAPPMDLGKAIAQAERRYDAQLEKLKNLYMNDIISMEELQADKAANLLALNELKATTFQDSGDMELEFANLKEAWGLASPELKKALVAEVFESIQIKERHIAAFQPKARYYPYLASKNPVRNSDGLDIASNGLDRLLNHQVPILPPTLLMERQYRTSGGSSAGLEQGAHNA